MPVSILPFSGTMMLMQPPQEQGAAMPTYGTVEMCWMLISL